MGRGEKIIPVGVKILSILYYIGAGISALTALILIIIEILLMINLSFIDISKVLPDFFIFTSNLGLGILVMGVFVAAIAVLEFFIGRGLSGRKLWAKILVIVFSVIGFVTGLISLTQGDLSGIINLVFSGVVGSYLIFNREAKSFFS